MTYVIADIHGDFDRYTEMLEKIHFDEERDVLFVLGDVLDYGEGGFQILLDMCARPNVYPILGEHEVMAMPLLQKLGKNASMDAVAKFDPETMQKFMQWGKNGGQESVRAFLALDAEDREWLLDYFEEFMPYEEIEVGGKTYVLVHAGLDNFSQSRDLEDYEIEELTTVSPDYSRPYFANKILVTGHKPTVEINPGSKGKIFKLNNHIAMDCGAAYGLPLGCLCLDTMEEFYVE